MKIVFDLAPVPASRPRVTQWGTHYAEKYTQFRADMGKLMLQNKRTMYKEPLRIDATFFILIPKSHSQKRKNEMDGTYCATNIDLDNLEKALYDSMNDYIYVDDRQIVEHTTRKKWVKENTRTEVEINII